jgi:L-malate glycosyltransferase
MTNKKLSIFISHPSEFLTNCRPHGDGWTAFNFIDYLARRGHTLHIAVPRMELMGKLPGNIKLYPIKTRARQNILHSLEYMLKSRLLLNRLRRTEHIDLIHQLNPVNTGLSLSMIGAGLPIVLGQFYAYWPSDADVAAVPPLHTRAQLLLKRWTKNALLAAQQRYAAALLVSSPVAAGNFYKPARVANKTHHLPPGVDLEQFTPAPPRPTDEAPNILFLASLWRRKGIYTLLEAFDLLAPAAPTCQLTIVGAGSEWEGVQQRVQASPYRDRISMLGQVTREQMPELMQNCTVYCLPSYGEPLSNSTLEVMACGKPVVVTDAGGLGTLVSAEGGRKVPPRDQHALAAALLEILTAPELQVRMGQHNRQMVETIYNWERVIDRLEGIYQTVLTAHASSPAKAGQALALGPVAVDD